MRAPSPFTAVVPWGRREDARSAMRSTRLYVSSRVSMFLRGFRSGLNATTETTRAASILSPSSHSSRVAARQVPQMSEPRGVEVAMLNPLQGSTDTTKTVGERGS
jgi:hypothetical protein